MNDKMHDNELNNQISREEYVIEKNYGNEKEWYSVYMAMKTIESIIKENKELSGYNSFSKWMSSFCAGTGRRATLWNRKKAGECFERYKRKHAAEVEEDLKPEDFDPECLVLLERIEKLDVERAFAMWLVLIRDKGAWTEGRETKRNIRKILRTTYNDLRHKELSVSETKKYSRNAPKKLFSDTELLEYVNGPYRKEIIERGMTLEHCLLETLSDISWLKQLTKLYEYKAFRGTIYELRTGIYEKSQMAPDACVIENYTKHDELRLHAFDCKLRASYSPHFKMLTAVFDRLGRYYDFLWLVIPHDTFKHFEKYLGDSGVGVIEIDIDSYNGKDDPSYRIIRLPIGFINEEADRQKPDKREKTLEMLLTRELMGR